MTVFEDSSILQSDRTNSLVFALEVALSTDKQYMSFVLKWENLKQDALKFSYPKYFKPWGKSPKIGCFLTSTVTMKELREDKLLGINQHAVGLLDLSGTWMQCDLFEIIFVEFKNVTLRWETMHWSCKECVKNTTAAVCPNLDIYSLQRQVNRNIWLLGL